MHMRQVMDLFETMSRPSKMLPSDVLPSGVLPSGLLLEVVLHTPVETALAGPLAEVDEVTVRDWFASVFRNWLLKQEDNLHRLTYLPPDATEQQKKAFAFHDLYDVRLTPAMQTLIGHLIDFFNANPNLPRLERMSVEAVKQAAEQWVRRMNAKAEREPDDPTQVKTLMEFPNGYAIVELTGANALSREGAKMGHCVGSYCDEVTSGNTRIFSLRDPNNIAHATIELITGRNAVRQIKGRQNRAPVQRYWPMIRQFLDSIKAEITGDYRNIGLLRIIDDQGEATVLTQDQFRDMVLDPADERAKRLTDPSRFMDDDTALGLFTALYGTERLSEPLIKRVFIDMADLAVQTIAHYGNKFSAAQLGVALKAVNQDRTDIETIKELLRVTKPDAETMAGVLTIDGDGQRRRGKNLMLALAQELPTVYATLLANNERLQTELDQPSVRAAGPFFVFVGSNQLTAPMIQKAFEHAPEASMKRVLRLKLDLSQDDVVAALTGLLFGYEYYRKSTYETVIDHVVAYGKPTTETLESLIVENSRYQSKALGSVILSAQKHVPDAVTQDLIEAVLRRLNDAKYYINYFLAQPNPSVKLQTSLFNSGQAHLLRYVQVIAPELFAQVYQHLRPAGVSPVKVEDKSKYTGGKMKRWSVKVAKTEAELGIERARARREAIRQFATRLDPLVRESDQDEADPIDPAAPKAQAARQVFAAMNKAALCDVALTYLNRVGEVRAIQGSGHPTSSQNLRRFAAALPHMRLADIVRVLADGYHHEAAFATVINHAPERVASVLRDWYVWQRATRHASNVSPPWNDFKAPISKDQAFVALETVWKSDLPQDQQDGFASVVLKRFKPSPAKLLTMLAIANNAEVTSRIVKKTAKPSLELIDFLLNKFPRIVLDAKAIPEQGLVHVLERNWPLAVRLMDRDLRGWGNGGRKWDPPAFHNTIERTSAVFARYATAAKAAGQAAAFEHYIIQSELDERLGQTERADIEANLTAYSHASLVRIVRRDNTMLKPLFQRFSPEQIAAIAQRGLFGSNGWTHTPVSLDGIDPGKLEQVARILADKEAKPPLAAMARALRETPLSDSMILTLLAGGEDRSTLLGKLTGDAAKNWVADHRSHDLGDIKQPTAHMIAVLFDTYTEVKHDSKGQIEIPFFFRHIIERWLGISHYFNHARPDRAVLTQIKDAALRRGGHAVTLTRMLFKQIAAQRAPQHSLNT